MAFLLIIFSILNLIAVDRSLAGRRLSMSGHPVVVRVRWCNLVAVAVLFVVGYDFTTTDWVSWTLVVALALTMERYPLLSENMGAADLELAAHNAENTADSADRNANRPPLGHRTSSAAIDCMITRIVNLVLAGLMVRVSFLTLVHMDGQTVWTDVLVPLWGSCWLAGAIGLFFGNRLAWCASLLGVGTLLAGSIFWFWTAWRMIPVASDPSDGIGMGMILGSIGFLLSVPLIVGLARVRRNWLASAG